MIVPHAHTIIISPLGRVEDEILAHLLTEIHHLFGFCAEVVPLLSSIDFAFDPVRNQYHSTPILEQLSSRAPATGLKVLGMVERDLFIPILTHVYGEAQLGGKACLISTFRLAEGLFQYSRGSLYQRRIVKEALHELGHTFNLRHCRDHSCIMHYCHSIGDVDRKADQLCRYCQILLEDELKRIRSGETVE